MLANFDLANGEPDPQALLQQNALIECVYNDDQAAAQQIVNLLGSGSVVAWQFQPQSWPPSYTLLRQGTNLYLCIAGTVNAQQWYGNVVGSFGGPYGSYACFAHSFFLDASNTLWEQLLPSLPADWRACNWYVSGHSYGAAAGFLVALKILQTVPAIFVQYLGFAEPKTLTSGYNGPLPNPRFCISTIGDAVPMVPPRYSLPSAQTAANALYYGIPLDWTHYESIYFVSSSGILSSGSNSDLYGPPNPVILGSTFTVHYACYYLRSCTAYWRSTGDMGQTSQVAAIGATVCAGGTVQVQAVNVPSLATVSIPQQNEQIYLQLPTIPLNQTNLATVETVSGVIDLQTSGNPIFRGETEDSMASPATKLTFYFHDNLGGFTDTWYSLTSPAFVFTAAQLVLYIRYRLRISGAQTTFDKCRVSLLSSPRQTATFFPNDFPSGEPMTGQFTLSGGPPVDQSDAPFTAVMINKLSTSTMGRWMMRGSPDEVAVLGGQLLTTSNFVYGIQQMYTRAISPLGLGWAAIQPGLPNYQNLLSAVIQEDGTVIFTVAGNLFTAPFNTVRVQARIRRLIDPSWLNGGITVTPLSATTCRSIRQTPVVAFVPGDGQMWIPNRTLFIPCTGLNAESVRSRKAGRPFGLYRGRQKGRVPV